MMVKLPTVKILTIQIHALPNNSQFVGNLKCIYNVCIPDAVKIIQMAVWLVKMQG